MLNTIFYFPVLCPDSDKFKNERCYISSHYNVRTDILPFPLFYNNKKAGVGKSQLHGYTWFLLWKNDWGAEFVLTAPALGDPTYTNTGRLYSKQTVLCIKLPMAAMQQNTDGHRFICNKNSGQTEFIQNN